ncbi:MAG: TRAP transporter substrate-binding protein DctP [Deltaproteobacteria bacterium]|nr:TRAP transporter substrate-binding protein DctP [Deltaproteobacteria bacterium]
MKIFRRRVFVLMSAMVLMGVLCLLPSGRCEAGLRLKIATLAPDGTTWMNVMKELAKEVSSKTSGKVQLKFYSGGVMGDEGDVIRKMRFGQLHGGGFTGRGLGEILPEERVVELPFLFANYNEVDCVQKKLYGHLSQAFAKKGFILLGWAEAGFVYVFSNRPIRKAADLKGVKMWMWEGDPLAKALFKANGIVPVPLDLPNVLTSMQTGLIDAVYSTPYAMVAFQWHTRVKYMVKTKLTYASGAILISKKEYDKLSSDEKQALQNAGATYTKKLNRLTRKENDDAINVLKKSGIQLVDLKEDVQTIKQKSTSIYTKLAGQLYSKELLDKVMGYRDGCRQK